MESIKGGCACGNIRFEATLPAAPSTYHPRACDCDFCTKHGASYISDPKGQLTIKVLDANLLQRYQQGTRLAEFLLCKHCGVLTHVIWRNAQGRQFGSINSRVVENTQFNEPKTISVQNHTPEESIKRWEANWFTNVVIN